MKLTKLNTERQYPKLGIAGPILVLLTVLALSLFCSSAHAYTRYSGSCEQGGQKVSVAGTTSTTYVQRSYPSCTVTVNVYGGSAATIYADELGTPLANPFTANSDGSWAFYAIDGRYTAVMTGAGITGSITLWDISGSSGYLAGLSSTATAAQNNAALAAAINSLSVMGGTIILPAGVFEISATIDLREKNGVILKGQGAAGLVTGEAHLTRGTVFKWVGAESDIIIDMTSAQYSAVESLGIDGMSVASCTGILIDSDNAPIARMNRLRSISVVNIGVAAAPNGIGIRIGTSGAVGFQSDSTVVEDFYIGLCGTGIMIDSSNAQSAFYNGQTYACNTHVLIQRGNWQSFKNIYMAVFLGANPSAVKAVFAGQVSLDQVITEPDEVPGAAYGHGVWIVNGAYVLPFMIKNSIINSVQIDGTTAISTENCHLGPVTYQATDVKWYSTNDSFIDWPAGGLTKLWGGSWTTVDPPYGDGANPYAIPRLNPGTNSVTVVQGPYENGVKYIGPAVVDFASGQIIKVGGVASGTVTSQVFKWGDGNANPYYEINNGTVIGRVQVDGTSNLLYLGTASNHPVVLIQNGAVKWQLDSAGTLGAAGGGGVVAGAGPAAINAVAVLQADSTTKGFLPPRMTTAQRTAITVAGGVANGLMVFDTDDQKLYVVESSAWVQK